MLFRMFLGDDSKLELCTRRSTRSRIAVASNALGVDSSKVITSGNLGDFVSTQVASIEAVRVVDSTWSFRSFLTHLGASTP